jgi:hypothetical protein
MILREIIEFVIPEEVRLAVLKSKELGIKLSSSFPASKTLDPEGNTGCGSYWSSLEELQESPTLFR